MLSPKAQRLVEKAMKGMPPADREAWRSVGRRPGGTIDWYTAKLVLAALEQLERKMQDALSERLGEDEAAEISNDLGFIRAVEKDVARELRD